MQDERNTLQALMESAGVIVDNIRGDGFHLDDSGWEHHRFRFALYVGSFDEKGMILSDAIWRQGLGIDRDPQPVDIFAGLLLDAGTVAGHEDWIAWADELGYFSGENNVDAIRKAQADFNEISARYSLMRERIDADTLAEMIDLAQQL